MASKPLTMNESDLQSLLDWFETSMQYIHDEIEGKKTVSLKSLNGNVLDKLTFKHRDKIVTLSAAAESMRNKVKALFNENTGSPQGPATCGNITERKDEMDKNMISIREITIMLKDFTGNKGLASGPGTLVHSKAPPQYKGCLKEVYNLVNETVAINRQVEFSKSNTIHGTVPAHAVIKRDDQHQKEDCSAQVLLRFVESLEKNQACEWPEKVELDCYKPSSNVYLAVDKLYKIARQNGIENSKHELELQSAKSQLRALHKSVPSKDTNSKENNDEQRNISREVVERDKKIHSLETQLQSCEKELQDSRLRLSALMGAKLQQGNPNIADLSDVNRPTKIAEQFSQLYDDEWTDAFNEQINTMKRSEQQAADRLLDMLKDTFLFCSGTSEVQMTNILKALGLSDITSKINSKTTLTFESFNEIQRKHLNELRRVTSSLPSNQLKNLFIEHMNNTKDGQKGKYTFGEIHESIPFLEKCVVVCWHMVLQDPSVSIQFEKENVNKTPFRGKEYRYYNRSGSTFDYIVWPPLRLMEGGDILMKGVAQPMI